MDKHFTLEIVTPTKTLNFEDVQYLRAPSLEGLFGVMSGHVASIINLDIGEVKVLFNNNENYFAISGGFAQVASDKVSLLVESIESKDEIDVERSNKSLERAKERLLDSTMNQVRAKSALERAKNRLKVSTR
ncbi:MAG: ATP synthase F1 subunit epsilon [Candidatus Marinimicrobia bacterium]|nr:ATP synthase F1 subunit epsilon [Candidatus Neomarinimicrobiota bacterium]MAR29870.1 ATP synthase F1 subunit epsilon [Candidatus Neomarinimicrobiota bacterium]